MQSKLHVLKSDKVLQDLVLLALLLAIYAKYIQNKGLNFIEEELAVISRCQKFFHALFSVSVKRSLLASISGRSRVGPRLMSA